MKKSIGVVIPTYNGGPLWASVVESLLAQRTDFDKILVIDSGSIDDTVQIAQKAGFETDIIPSSDFNHGKTRNYGLHKIGCDIVVFLTQDAILENKSISLLTQAFENDLVAVAYGRQLPHDNATPIATHARLFNYGKESHLYGIQDRDQHGIKTVFASNSFSAYRSDYFMEIGEFPENIIFSEDMYFAAKAVLAGYRICYVSNANCKHSHNYTLAQEFRRYFDIGVFHRNEPWIQGEFGKIRGEGMKFIQSEFSYLFRNKNFFWIPLAFINNFFKISGYKSGLFYNKLPRKLAAFFSTCKSYWSKT